MRHRFEWKRDVNCFLVLARSLLGCLLKMIQCFEEASAMSSAVVVRRGTISAIFEKRSTSSNYAVVHLFDWIVEIKMLLLTDSSGLMAWNSLRAVACLQSLIRSRAHEVPLVTTVSEPTLKDVQKKCLCKKHIIFRTLGWPAIWVWCAVWATLCCEDFAVTTTGFDRTTRGRILSNLSLNGVCRP